MRAVMLDVPERLLEQRRRMGADVFDEVWEGVLHMVPPPSSHHQRLGARLVANLLPLAEARGLVTLYETALRRKGTGWDDYRVPDLIVARHEHVSDEAVEGPALLVVEILSPGDETYDKLGFFAELGVEEVLVVEPLTKAVELFVLRGGRLVAALPDGDGTVTLSSLGLRVCTLETADGASLRLAGSGGTADL